MCSVLHMHTLVHICTHSHPTCIHLYMNTHIYLHPYPHSHPHTYSERGGGRSGNLLKLQISEVGGRWVKALGVQA